MMQIGGASTQRSNNVASEPRQLTHTHTHTHRRTLTHTSPSESSDRTSRRRRPAASVVVVSRRRVASRRVFHLRIRRITRLYEGRRTP